MKSTFFAGKSNLAKAYPAIEHINKDKAVMDTAVTTVLMKGLAMFTVLKSFS